MTDPMVDPRLVDPLVELLAQAEENSRLADAIDRLARRIAARRDDE